MIITREQLTDAASRIVQEAICTTEALVTNQYERQVVKLQEDCQELRELVKAYAKEMDKCQCASKR